MAGSTAALVKTSWTITTTSASDQTWSVPDDWNSADNKIEVYSAGAQGGGGGYAKASNQTLTPGGSAKFRLREGNAGSGVANACWFGNASTTSLATSLCGIQCASSSAGASTTSAVGSTKYAGGNPGNAANGGTEEDSLNRGGGGGGAAGSSGAGGNGGNASSSPTPGTSGGTGGSSGGGSAGGGGTGSGDGFDSGATDGSSYGGGGGQGGDASAAGNGAQGVIVITNNASL